MQNIIRTAQSALVQTQLMLGLTPTILPHTTLNEKFNINQTVLMGPTDKLAAQYIAIGNGGHRMTTGTGGITYPVAIQHATTDCALYNHLPFILRLPSNDLTPLERANYRLRTIVTINNVNYVAYYLKLLDFTNVSPELQLRVVNAGVTTSTVYTPTVSGLNPVPPVIPSTGVISTTGNYIAASAIVDFIMGQSSTSDIDDLTEFLNVANIMYGDTNYAIISEIALCSGVDRSVTGTFGGVTQGYTDSIGVQVVSFISSMFAANFANGSIELIMDLGIQEPLLNLS